MDKAFDLIGNMGDNLHCSAQIFTAALFIEHIPVDAARSQ